MTTDRIFTDTQALDMMHEQLSGREWDSSDIERIAELITLTGRTIAEPCDLDDDECTNCGGISPLLSLDELADSGLPGPCPECDERASAALHELNAHVVMSPPVAVGQIWRSLHNHEWVVESVRPGVICVYRESVGSLAYDDEGFSTFTFVRAGES